MQTWPRHFVAWSCLLTFFLLTALDLLPKIAQNFPNLQRRCCVVVYNHLLVVLKSNGWQHVTELQQIGKHILRHNRRASILELIDCKIEQRFSCCRTKDDVTIVTRLALEYFKLLDDGTRNETSTKSTYQNKSAYQNIST